MINDVFMMPFRNHSQKSTDIYIFVIYWGIQSFSIETLN